MHAFDLDFSTRVVSGQASDGGVWIAATLDHIYCVDYVLKYKANGTVQFRWECSGDDCADCTFVGNPNRIVTCKVIRLLVQASHLPPELPRQANCKYGDSVKIERFSGDPDTIIVTEIAVFTRKGNQ